MSYEKILEDYDVLGTKGCLPFKRRNNLLITVDEVYPQFGKFAFQFTQIAPEGLGIGTFNMDMLEIPADCNLESQQLLIWKATEPPKLHVPIWIFDVQEHLSYRDQFMYTYIYDHASSWAPLPSPDQDQPFRVAELFAGGFGGWKAAGSVIRQYCEVQSQFISVEHCLPTAIAFAITHKTGFIPGTEFLHAGSFDNKKNWIVLADVFDTRLRLPLATWAPHMITISAPCPPWSGAAHAPGLNSEDGQMLMKAILECRWYRPHMILIEQVLGFNHHPHKKEIIRTLHHVGFRLIMQKTLDLQDLTYTSRVRWLGLAIRVHSNLPFCPLQNWPKIEHNQHPFPKMTLPAEMVNQTAVTEPVKQVASDVRFAKNMPGKSSTEVLKSRIYQAGDILPTFMARYGSQHCIDSSLLQSHGYFGHFVADGNAPNGFRFWHAAEIAMIHGVFEGCFLPTNQAEANQLLGNMISTQHALVLLVNGMNRILQSPIDLKKVCAFFHASQVVPSACQMIDMANGYYLTHRDTLMLHSFQTHVELLHRWAFQHDTMHVWLPDHGLLLHDQIPEAIARRIAPSVITIADASDTSEEPEHDVDPWHPFLQGELKAAHNSTFWYSADLPGSVIERVWAHEYQLTFQSVEDRRTAIMQRPDTVPACIPEVSNQCVVSLIDGELTITSVNPDQPLMKQDRIKSIAPILYDQYGQMDIISKPKFSTVLLDQPLQPGTLPQHLAFYAAANQQITTNFFQSHDDDTFVIQFQGSQPCIAIMKEFWTNSIQPDSLHQLGRRCEDQANELRFTAIPNQGTCPIPIFRDALAVLAAKALLNAAVDTCTTATEVLIKWDRPVWRGMLPAGTSIQTVQMLLQFAFSPAIHNTPLRVVSNGKTQPSDTMIGQLQGSPHRQHAVILFATAALRGGGTKQQQKAVMQNAIATTLLDQGYELSWTTATVDSIVQKTNLQRLQTITARNKASERLQEVLQLCREHKIDIPQPAASTTREAFAGAPWNKKKKKPEFSIRPQDYTITSGFFTNDDGTDAVQISSIRPQATGVALMNAADALPFLHAGQKTSTDELALIALGPLPPTDMKGEEVTIPCTNPHGHQVLLHGKMFQLGGKDIQINKGATTQIQSDACQLFAITLYKDTWKEHQWQDIISGTMGFIRRILQADALDTSIHAIWGRSLRQGKAAASPAQATSIQVHTTIEHSAAPKMMQKSGFNGLFVTPKLPSGRVATDFRVIWTKTDMAKSLGYSTQTANCQGLVRGRNGALGLRFHSKDFDAAWALLYPNVDPPADFSGNMTYKLEGLPFGTSQQAIMQWAKSQKWECKPFRAIGPTSWVVKAAKPPPDGLLMYNSSPLLVRFLEPRSAPSNKILTGPRTRVDPSETAHQDPWQQGIDPWTFWKPTSSNTTSNAVPMPAARTTGGPIDARFAAQEATIATLRDDLNKLAAKHDEHSQAVKQQFIIAEKREQAEFQQIKVAMQTMQKEMDSSLAQTMQQHSKAMDSQSRELKSLFQQAGKRSKPDDEDENMG